MIEFDNNLKSTLVLYLLVCGILYNYKPRFMFNNDGSFKEFGLTQDKTIYPYWLIVSISGFLIYLLCLIKNCDYI